MRWRSGVAIRIASRSTRLLTRIFGMPRLRPRLHTRGKSRGHDAVVTRHRRYPVSIKAEACRLRFMRFGGSWPPRVTVGSDRSDPLLIRGSQVRLLPGAPPSHALQGHTPRG